jgi:cyclic pyranopterin monophosphate synthase
MSAGLTHFDADGRVRMVDVSDKPITARMAIAEGCVTMLPETLALALGGAKKGDVRAISEIAGVQGAKKTAELIPLCHPLALTGVKVLISHDEALPGLRVRAEVKTTGQTGVEMEALTAVSIACLTIYDMLKAAEKAMVIGPIVLVEKAGGASGDFQREGLRDG